jgi:hypothetical protein
MRAVFIYFVSLILFTLTGYGSANACVVKSNIQHPAAQAVSKLQLPVFAQDNQSSPIVKHAASAEKEEDFIIAENEDDDCTFSKKETLQAKCIIALTYAAVLGLLDSGEVKIQLPHYKYLSYTSSPKYILQRDLRI